MIIRHTAGSIAAFVGVLLIVPMLTPAFPASIQNVISKFEPTTIARLARWFADSRIAVSSSIVTRRSFCSFSSSMRENAGLAILSTYAAVALGVGAWRLVRRDA